MDSPTALQKAAHAHSQRFEQGFIILILKMRESKLREFKW